MSSCSAWHLARSILAVLLIFQTVQAQTDIPPGQVPKQQLPKLRALDYEFDDVRIATILSWLRRVSVEPPVPLTGTVSGWLWAQAPASGWWRVGDYRVEGEVTSPLLGVDRFAIRAARVRFGYQQGLWTIGAAQGQIETDGSAQPSQQLGQAQLSATLPTNTRSNAHVEGELSSVQLANLLETFGLEKNVPQGLARATFRIDTPLANLSTPLAWTATGHISANDLQWANLSGLTIDSDVGLRDEVLSLTRTQVRLPGPTAQALTLSGQLKLRDAYEWQVQLPNQSVQLNELLFRYFMPTGTTLNNLPTGTMQLAGKISGMLTPWSAQYALQVSNGQLAWLGNLFSNVNTKLSMTSNGLAIESLTLQAANGSLAGAATFTTNLDEPLNITLNYRQIDLSTLRAPIELPNMSGRVSGQAKLSIDKHRLTDLKSIAADVTGDGQGVRFDDWGLGNVEYKLNKLADQDNLKIELQDAGQSRRWLATGQLTSNDDNSWRYQIDARGNALDLSIPQLIRLIGTDPQLPVPLEILLATGNVIIEGDTTRGVQATDFNFSNITTLERDRRVWSQGSMVGRTTQKFVEIKQSQWKVGGSDIEAALKWHYLADDQPLNAQPADLSRDHLKLKVNRLSLETLQAWQIISLPLAGAGRRALNGDLSANVDLERPAGAKSWLTHWQGQVKILLEDLNLNGNDAGRVTLDGQLTPEQWQGQLAGNLLQAPVTGDVTLKLKQEPTLAVSRATGQLTWPGAQVSQLVSLWQGREQATQWRGLSNLRTDFSWDENGEQSGTAEIEIAQLAYRQRMIVRNLQAIAALDNNRLQLVRFDGGLGGGRVDVSGALDLKTRLLEGVVVQLQRVSLEEVAQLIDPKWNQELAGRADLRAQVRIDRGLDVHGDLRLHDVKWSGLPIDEMHAGFEMTGARDGSVVRLKTSTARGRIMGGRADADLQARLGARNSVDLRLRVDRGEVEQLSKWTGTSSVVGKGKFNAVLNASAGDLRSVRDLQGVLDLSFEDTDARTLPVADQLTRFVPLFGLPSTEFERGKLSATISRGDLRMRSLALWGRQLSVLGSGNVGMVSGRLDMQLVIRTGGGLSQQVAANYLTQLAATTVPQVELLLQINRLVANRAIFLRVAGTTSQPVIQPQAAQMIQRALLRSLLEQAVPIVPTAALGSSSLSNN